MLSTFVTTVNQILMLLGFMLIGYIMKKKHIGGDNVSAVLSAVEVNVFLPATCLKTFSDNCTVSGIAQNADFLYAGIIVIICSFVLAKPLSRLFAKNDLQRDVYMYSFLIPNIGYMGYPLIEAVFGSEMLFKMMIFVIPFHLMIYTYGMYILNPKRELSFKRILNPTMISIILGIILGLTQFKLPTFINSMVGSAKACMAPPAMILTGFVLASIPLKPVLTSARTYLAALIRGIVLPGIAFAVMYFLNVDRTIMVIAVGCLAMPMGVNSIVFPEAFGGDSMTGAKTCLVSNIISIVTIPLVFAFLGNFI